MIHNMLSFSYYVTIFFVDIISIMGIFKLPHPTYRPIFPISLTPQQQAPTNNSYCVYSYSLS